MLGRSPNRSFRAWSFLLRPTLSSAIRSTSSGLQNSQPWTQVSPQGHRWFASSTGAESSEVSDPDSVSDSEGEISDGSQDDGPSLWELVQLEEGSAGDWMDLEKHPELATTTRSGGRELPRPLRPHLWLSEHPETLIDELKSVFPEARHRVWHGMVHSVGEAMRSPAEWFPKPKSDTDHTSPDHGPKDPLPPLDPVSRPPTLAFAQQYIPHCVKIPALWPDPKAVQQLAAYLQPQLQDHTAAGGSWVLHVMNHAGPVFPSQAGREARLKAKGKQKRPDRKPRTQLVKDLLRALRHREFHSTSPSRRTHVRRDRAVSMTRTPCVMEQRHWRRLREQKRTTLRATETVQEQLHYLRGAVASESSAVLYPSSSDSISQLSSEFDADLGISSASSTPTSGSTTKVSNQKDSDTSPMPSVYRRYLETHPQDHRLPPAIVQVFFNEHLPAKTRLASRRRQRGVARGGDSRKKQAVFVSVILPHEAAALERIGLSAVSGGKVNVPPVKTAPSGAHRKLLEAEIRLGQSVAPGELVVDLGWVPGSWSFVGLARKARVISVDVSRFQEKPREDLIRSVARFLQQEAQGEGPTIPGVDGSVPRPEIQFVEADASRWTLPSITDASKSSLEHPGTLVDSSAIAEEAAEDPHAPRIVDHLLPVAGGATQRADWLFCDIIATPDVTLGILRRWLEQRLCKRFVVVLKFVGGSAQDRLVAVEEADELCREHQDVYVEGSPGGSSGEGLGRLRYLVRHLNANGNEVTIMGTYVLDQ